MRWDLGIFNNCLGRKKNTLPLTRQEIQKANREHLDKLVSNIEAEIQHLTSKTVDKLDNEIISFTQQLQVIHEKESIDKNKAMNKSIKSLEKGISHILYTNKTKILKVILAFAAALIAHYLTGGLSLIPKVFCVAAGFVAGWHSNKPAYAMAQSFGFFQTEKRVVEYADEVKRYYGYSEVR